MNPLPPRMALHYAHMVAEERQREASRIRLARDVRARGSAPTRPQRRLQETPRLRAIQARALGLLAVVIVTGGMLLLMAVTTSGVSPTLLAG